MTRSLAPYHETTTRGIRVMAHESVASALTAVLAGGNTLHTWAARTPNAVALQGRATAWRVTLASGEDVVVRHSAHGGMLAALTGDLFLSPTRAPAELAASLRLRAEGVPTPEVLAYAIYPAFGPLVRADVVTRTLEGRDLPDAWRATTEPAARTAIVQAVAELLRRLRHAGAVHPDLNLKNVFIMPTRDGVQAAVLDVDRVLFGEANSATAAYRNLIRLVRSARKWRRTVGLDFDDPAVLMPLTATAGSERAS